MRHLVITNTMYPKSDAHKITYVGPNQRGRQIDYVLVSKRMQCHLRDSGSAMDVDMGSDHKTVRTKFELKLGAGRKVRKSKQRVIWSRVCEATFKSKTEQLVTQKEVTTKSLSTCHLIEETLLQAAKESMSARHFTEIDHENDALHIEIQTLVQSRQKLPHGDPERAVLSKRIQKTVRLRKRGKRREQI